MGTVRYNLGPSNYDIFRVMCNKDKCNSQSNEHILIHVTDANGNEFIGSTATKSRLISFSFYYFGLVLINTFFSL
jgi:hypothetical protein